MTRIPSRAPILCGAIVLLCTRLATVSGELRVETEPRLLRATAALALGQVRVIGSHPRGFEIRYFGSMSDGQRVGVAKRAFAACSRSWVRELE